MNSKNLWILTEERPKNKVLQMIFGYFAKDKNCGFFADKIRIIPLLDERHCFSFTYEVIGFKCAKVDKIFVKTVSGYSSFVDFLVFYQNSMPKQTDTPLYVIEETKTDDKESRNTGVYQRCSKFIFTSYFYPNTKMIMLYALQVKQKETPTATYVFGTRLMRTIGIDIIGKKLDKNLFQPFESVDEIIESKNQMKSPSRSNTPITISKQNNRIEISGRLVKNGRLAHDPNIGALSVICAALRKLGWQGKIEITQHGLIQHQIGNNNKFVRISNLLGIELKGLSIPQVTVPKKYRHYDTTGEKLATIFIHIVVENFTESYSIFENHAGCEKGYFVTSTGEYIPLVKYIDRTAYKDGDKSKIVAIPDLVLIDIKETEIITIEGKTYENCGKGIDKLQCYDAFEELYIKSSYPQFKVIRTVVLYGSNHEKISEIQVGFLLNEQGKLVLGIKAPKLFRRAICNLLDYWK